MYKDKLRRFNSAIIRRGLQIDLTGTLIDHTHTKLDPMTGRPVDPDAKRPLMKLHFCTAALRPEGQMLQEDIDTIGCLMWRHAKQHDLPIPAIASVPRVGDEIVRAFLRAARKDGFVCPHLKFAKLEHGVHFGRVTNDAGYPRGHPLVIVDDVCHKSHSKQRMKAGVEIAGYWVSSVFVFMDYEHGARQFFDTLGIPFHYVLGVRQSLLWGLEDGDLEKPVYDALINYLDEARGAAS